MREEELPPVIIEGDGKKAEKPAEDTPAPGKGLALKRISLTGYQPSSNAMREFEEACRKDLPKK